jgi:hypothetical protein
MTHKYVAIITVVLAVWLAIFVVTKCQGQTPVEHVYVIPGKIAVEWKFVDAPRIWLSINSYGGSDWEKEGYHPGFTNIMSKYKPIVKQLPGGMYEITFSSEIAKNIP